MDFTTKAAAAAPAIEVAEKTTDPTPPPAKKFRYQQGRVQSSENLYLNAEFADVHFIIGSEPTTRVPAHKCILAGASDVFKGMFYGNLKECGDIRVINASDAVFREFLQFFYLADVDLTPENVTSVLNLGRKYNVKKCIDGCSQFLIDTLTDENVCTMLAVAIHYNNEQQQLMKACERRILMNTAAVFRSVAFLACEKVVLEYILNMPQLSCSEVKIFDACMAWVGAKSKPNKPTKITVEKYLIALYYNIRFALMTFQEFCELEMKYESVLSSDFKTIMRLIAGQLELNSHCFTTSPRRIQWNSTAVLKCNRNIMGWNGRRYELSTEEKTTFVANQMVLLGALGFQAITYSKSNPRELRSDLPVLLKISEIGGSIGGETLASINANLQSTGSTILLPHPILIRPGFPYIITISEFPNEYFGYFKDFQKVVKIGTDTEISFLDDKCDDKGNVYGFISTLDFNCI